MVKHLLSVLAFVVVTFSVQGLSHFVVNASHYDTIGFARPDPVMSLGFVTMGIQGLVLSLALASWRPNSVTIADGLTVAMSFGIVLVSYVAFAEPAKYAAPSIPGWIVVEAPAGLIQWGIFGLLLGLIHMRIGRGKMKTVKNTI